jgi:hypothetical protein
VIATFHTVEPKLPPDTWQHEFEDAFYNKGLGVFFSTIDDINQALHRTRIPELEFDETHISE